PVSQSLTGVPLVNGIVAVTVNTPTAGQLVALGTLTGGGGTTTPVGCVPITAALAPQNGTGVSGTVTLSGAANNTFTVTATIVGLLPGSTPTLTIPTTTGTVTTTGSAGGT